MSSIIILLFCNTPAKLHFFFKIRKLFGKNQRCSGVFCVRFRLYNVFSFLLYRIVIVSSSARVTPKISNRRNVFYFCKKDQLVTNCHQLESVSRFKNSHYSLPACGLLKEEVCSRRRLCRRMAMLGCCALINDVDIFSLLG